MRKIFIGLAVAFLFASWVFPPWVHYNPRASGYSAEIPRGWFWIFDTNQGENANIVVRVDFGRLVLLDAALVVAAGVVAWLLRKVRWRDLSARVLGGVGAVWRKANTPNARLALLIALTAGVVAWRVAVAWREAEATREQKRIEEAKIAEERMQAERIRSERLKREREEAIAAEERKAKIVMEIEAERKRQAQIAENQKKEVDAFLAKMEDLRVPEQLFSFIEASDFSYRSSPFNELRGRINNGLQRRINSVGLKVTLFDPDTKKIATVERVVVSGPFNPGEPKSFSLKKTFDGLGGYYYPLPSKAEITAAFYEE